MSSSVAAKKQDIERKGRVREVVFGVQDGLLTTLGFVAGLQGATSDNHFVRLAGLVEVLAGAMSMAAGAYLSSKAEVEVYEKEIADERRRFEKEPYLASEELVLAMTEEGLPRDKAYKIVLLIQTQRHALLKTFQEKVLGLPTLNPSTPVSSALVIGLWFVLGSCVPLAPYFFLPHQTALWAAVSLSTAALFGIGAVKGRLADRSWWRSGLEFLLVAAGAAGLGYAFGLLLPAH